MRIIHFVAALCLVAGLPSGAVAESTAGQTVDALHGALIQSMQSGTRLSFDQRSVRLAPVVNTAFDFDRICRILGGRHWKSFSAEQQATFIDTFSRLVVSNYTDNFREYDGHAFHQIAEEDLKRGRKLVRTSLREPDGDTVSLDYVLGPDGDGWRIINVVAEGVSDLALKRAEYGSILTNSGYAELMGRLDEQILRNEKTRDK